jgi:prefoldin subunit 5
MSVTTILDVIRRKKTVAKQTSFGAYMDLVRAVSLGQETDADAAADVIELAGKTDEDFVQDCETQQNRYEWHRQLESVAGAQDTIARLTTEHEQLQQKLNAAIAKYQPGISEAFTAIHQLEQQILSATGAEPKLLHSCFDKTLLDREAELNGRHIELQQQRRPLVEDFERARNMRSTYETALRNEKAAEAKESYGPAKANRQKAIDVWKRKIANNESVYRQLEAALKDIDTELEPIQKELREIRKAKLTP